MKRDEIIKIQNIVFEISFNLKKFVHVHLGWSRPTKKKGTKCDLMKLENSLILSLRGRTHESGGYRLSSRRRLGTQRGHSGGQCDAASCRAE